VGWGVVVTSLSALLRTAGRLAAALLLRRDIRKAALSDIYKEELEAVKETKRIRRRLRDDPEFAERVRREFTRDG
jgi:hypothetical protein